MEQLLKHIQEHAAKTGNVCGISEVDLARKSGYEIKKTKELLNQAYKLDRVQVREGINHNLIFAV